MYGCNGIKASELVEILQFLISTHGDRQVMAGGGDYPEGVRGAHVQSKEQANGYVPEGVIYLT